MYKQIFLCILLFADEVVVVDESRVGINRKLELWRWILEYKRFRLGRSKIEYIWCGFRGIGGEMGEDKHGLRGTPFNTWDQCCKEMVVSMRMLAT